VRRNHSLYWTLAGVRGPWPGVRASGFGLRASDRGLRTAHRAPRTTDHGPRTTDHGLRVDKIVARVYKVDFMPPKRAVYLGEFEYLVLLGILRLGAGAYALNIGKALESEAARPTQRSALYTTLDRLEAKGLVRWKIAGGGANRDHLPRRVYTVTAAGMASLRAAHRSMSRMARGLESLLEENS
jgi:PadR family transcriptional regulator, regulatory protein PadR